MTPKVAVGVDPLTTKEDHLKTLLNGVYRGELQIINPEVISTVRRRSRSLSQIRDILGLVGKISRYTDNLYHSENTQNITNYNQILTHTTPTHQLYPVSNSSFINNNKNIEVPHRDLLYFRVKGNNCFRSFKYYLKQGGRFYGMIHQQLPAAIRLNSLINGEEVVELDFEALHPSLLYSSLGIQPSKNIYVFTKDKDPRQRYLMKLILLIGFNEKCVKTAINAVRLAYHEKYDVMLTNDHIQNGIDIFFEEHPALQKFWGKEVALELQYTDSLIMDQILITLRKKDIPAIPVHDSVIVPKQHQETSQQAMIDAYQKVTGTDHEPFITIEVAGSQE